MKNNKIKSCLCTRNRFVLFMLLFILLNRQYVLCFKFTDNVYRNPHLKHFTLFFFICIELFYRLSCLRWDEVFFLFTYVSTLFDQRKENVQQKMKFFRNNPILEGPTLFIKIKKEVIYEITYWTTSHKYFETSEPLKGEFKKF